MIGRKVVINSLLAALLVLCALGPVCSSTRGIFWDSGGTGWNNAPVNSNTYSVLATDAVRSNEFFGISASGGLDQMYESGGWHTVRINSNTYTAIATDRVHSEDLFVARSNGGFDQIYWSGGSWVTVPINSNTYARIASDGVSEYELVGVRAGGGLDRIRWLSGSGWVTSPINSNNYTATATDNVHVRDWFGIRANAGLDQIYLSVGGTWTTYQISSTRYRAIATDSVKQEVVYAARVAGGLDRLSWNSGWQTVSISSDTYTAIATDGVNTEEVYGVRADGGLDFIHKNGTGGWVTEQIEAADGYTVLTTDAQAGRKIFCCKAATTVAIDQVKNVVEGKFIRINNAVVTARFRDTGSVGSFGIKDPDGFSGIRVISNAVVLPGNNVTVEGTAAIISGERVIDAANGSVSIESGGDSAPLPIGFPNAFTAGAESGFQESVVDNYPLIFSKGANNVGTLMKIWGRVTSSNDTGGYDGYFYVDDGSGLRDPSGNLGIRCRPLSDPWGQPRPLPEQNSFAVVTGLMGVRQIDGVNARYLWTSSLGDTTSTPEESVTQLVYTCAGDAFDTTTADSASTGMLALAQQWEQSSGIANQMYAHEQALTSAAESQLATPASSAAWLQRKQDIQNRLLKSFGFIPMPEKTPLKASIVGTVDYPEYTLEKITYEAWQGIPISAHLYIPKNKPQPLPCVLYTMGHWYNGKTEVEPRSFCVGAAKLGLAVLIYDPMGQGERYAAYDHGHRYPILSGLSQEGFMVWETMRTMDYLLTRPEIDPNKIGLTGASGGGLNTVYAAALDERYAAVAPVCYPTTFLDLIAFTANVDWGNGYDLCNQIPFVIPFARTSDLMGCVAPRPQLQISAIQDVLFRIQYSRQNANETSSIYALLSSNGFSYTETNSVHGYDKLMREAAYGFFLKQLAGTGDGSPVTEPAMTLEPWNTPGLKCFSDGLEPTGPLLVGLTNSRLPQNMEFGSVPEAAQLPAWQANLRTRISDICVVPASTSTSSVAASSDVGGVTLRRILVTPESGIKVPILLAAAQGTSPTKAVLVISEKSKTQVISSVFARRLIDQGYFVCAADLRGLGESQARDFQLGADLWMLGRTLPGEWIADVNSLSTYLRNSVGITNLCLVGTDGMAEVAMLAAAVNTGIDSVVANGALSSYRELIRSDAGYNEWHASIHIPWSLHHFDLPTALAAIAPREALIVRPVNGKRVQLTEEQSTTVFGPPTTAYSRLGALDALRILTPAQ